MRIVRFEEDSEMGHPLVTALFLIAAGALFFRRRDWTHRWIGVLLVSAGLNTVAGISNDLRFVALIAWVLLAAVLCMVGLFEDPKKR